jgi:hypothetical protein
MHDRHRGVVVDHHVRAAAAAGYPIRFLLQVLGGRRGGGAGGPGPPRVRSAAPNSVSVGLVGITTWTRCSSAPYASANAAAQPTAFEAVCDRSVPTITRPTAPFPSSVPMRA